jgi:hypothetical protein
MRPLPTIILSPLPTLPSRRRGQLYNNKAAGLTVNATPTTLYSFYWTCATVTYSFFLLDDKKAGAEHT